MANAILNALGDRALGLQDVLVQLILVIQTRQPVVVHVAKNILSDGRHVHLPRRVSKIRADERMQRRGQCGGNRSQIAHRQVLSINRTSIPCLREHALLQIHGMDERTGGNDALVQRLEIVVVAVHNVLHLVRILGKPRADITVVAQTGDGLRMTERAHPN